MLGFRGLPPGSTPGPPRTPLHHHRAQNVGGGGLVSGLSRSAPHVEPSCPELVSLSVRCMAVMDIMPPQYETMHPVLTD